MPLYNIFKLYNRNDVEQEFADALSEDGDYANLLEQVSTETTKVFRKIWKDFKATKIELLSSGTEILTKISEKAKYSFEDRSDGFKKFISISSVSQSSFTIKGNLAFFTPKLFPVSK